MSKPQKTRTRLSPDVRKQEILEFTASVVSQEGVFAVSIERIGKALDISKSTVYSYYPSTTELLQALLKREMKSLRGLQQQAMEAANTVEQLVRGINHNHLNYIESRGLLISRLQAEPSVASIGGSTDFGRETAVQYIAKMISETFDLPMAITVPGVDISFGLPEAAAQCLNRKVADKRMIEDLTVSMILASVKALKESYEINMRPLPKLNLT